MCQRGCRFRPAITVRTAAESSQTLPPAASLIFAGLRQRAGHNPPLQVPSSCHEVTVTRENCTPDIDIRLNLVNAPAHTAHCHVCCADSLPSKVPSRRGVLTVLSNNQAADSPQPCPDISLLSKQLQQQWDHAANLHLGKVIIHKFSNKKVWWTCDQCPDGHSHKWQSQVDDRSGGRGCPYCSGHRVCKHNSLATLAPVAATFWDTAKNGCTPEEIVAKGGQRAHWHCSVCKHEWLAKPADKTRNQSGCPICSQKSRTRPKRHPTFAECQHPLLQEWDFERNVAAGLVPARVTLSSGKKVHWLCHQCPLGVPHSWLASPAHRTHGRGCPFCGGQAVCECNSLQTLFPSIAAEWHHELNYKTPNDYTSGSEHAVWWHNKEKGSWQQTIRKRTAASLAPSIRLRFIQDNP